MPVFSCSECDHVDNSATSNYWERRAEGRPLLCSLCDPEIGRWHGRFPRRLWADAYPDQPTEDAADA